MYRDPNLTGRNDRGGPLEYLQDLRTAGSREHNSLHDRNLGAAAAVSPRTPAIAARAAKPIATISPEAVGCRYEEKIATTGKCRLEQWQHCGPPSRRVALTCIEASSIVDKAEGCVCMY